MEILIALVEIARKFFEAHWLSFIIHFIAGIAMIVLAQATWRSGMPKDENLKVAAGGLITIVMGLFAPGSILPVVAGLTWMLVVWLWLEKNKSPTLWSIAAVLGIGIALLSFTVWSWVATPLALTGGCYVAAVSMRVVLLSK